MFRQLLAHRFVRFCLVGGLNTAVDVSIYLLLRSLGLELFLALLISTSAGLLVGYRLHTSFTFQQDRAKFTRFLIITLAGLWIIQPLIAYASEKALASIALTGVIIWLAGKLLASSGSLIWNYTLYRKFVYTN